MTAMWVRAAFAAIIASFAVLQPASAQLAIEDMTDRPGADYRVIDIPAPIPPLPGPRVGWGACRIECNEDFQCKAWSYEPPPLGGAAGTCRLKDNTPPPVIDPCCVSGVKPTAPPFPWGETSHERDTYRTGDEMRVFAFQKSDAKGWMCEYACAIEVDWLSGDRCISWSFEATPNDDRLCRLFRDEPGGVFREGDVSGKLPF
jgi:hypothetical protein